MPPPVSLLPHVSVFCLLLPVNGPQDVALQPRHVVQQQGCIPRLLGCHLAPEGRLFRLQLRRELLDSDASAQVLGEMPAEDFPQDARQLVRHHAVFAADACRQGCIAQNAVNSWMEVTKMRKTTAAKPRAALNQAAVALQFNIRR